MPVELRGKTFTLTGILPKSEFQAKAAWGGAGIFSRPIGCGASVGMMGSEDKKTLARKRVIDTLDDDEVLVGADVAAKLGLKEADKLEVLGKKFNVTAILPQTGTVDDSRIFAHLHVVQDLSKKGPVINAIEVIGCCQQISKGLVEKINQPAARRQGGDHHADRRRADQDQPHDGEPLAHVSGDYHFRGRGKHRQLHVRQRVRAAAGDRHADGAGADSGLVLRIFLLKALILGVAGGIGGYVLGTILAVVLGPKLAGVIVLPMPLLALLAVGISVGLALVASYFPGPPCGPA